jgi:hypothetical protein
MTRIILSGTMTAVSLGLGCSTLFAIVYGTAALPFVVSACLGFGLGTYGFYRDAVTKACIALDRYPLLLRLHLHANFPSQRFDTWDLGRLRTAFRRESLPRWQLRSMLIASWMTATPALDVSLFRSLFWGVGGLTVWVQRIMELEEEAIVAAEVERQAWKE